MEESSEETPRVMLRRYIEDPSDSVIHKTEKLMTTTHEG